MTRRLNAPREERLRGVGDNCCHGRVAKCSVRRGGWVSSSGKEWLSGGKKWLSCILEGRSDAKKASSWQDIAEMHFRTAFIQLKGYIIDLFRHNGLSEGTFQRYSARKSLFGCPRVQNVCFSPCLVWSFPAIRKGTCFSACPFCGAVNAG